MKGISGKLKERIANREYLVGGCVMDGRSGAVIEAFNDAAFDFVLIDREHTALNSETIQDHIRLCRTLDLPCMVRVAEDSYAELNRTLDQLPDGIFVPRIRSREQVEKIMEAVKYPPIGKRGVGGSTCPAGKYMGWGSVPEQLETLNRKSVVGIQIETKEALENLDAILSVHGIDVAVVGNDDLSAGMGIPGQWSTDTYRDAVKEVIRVCNKYGVLPGIAAGHPKVVKYWAENGMKMFWSAADICLLWEGAVNKSKELHQLLETI